MPSRENVVFASAAVLSLAAAPALAGPPPSFSLSERVQCQAAIERVYAQHRSASSATRALPDAVIRARAEDAVLESAALERIWGIAITGPQLQAELDRMAANSQAPEVLSELWAALGGDAGRAAECLARPLLADRIIQTAYAFDERLHGALEARVRRELQGIATAEGLKASSGVYREVEWQARAQDARRPDARALDRETFEARAREVERALAGQGSGVAIGQVSALREDESRFYVVAVLAFDDQRIRLATVEWGKRPFRDWWAGARREFPADVKPVSFDFTLPPLPRPRCRDDSWTPTLQLLDPRYWHTAVWTGSEMIVFGGMSAVGTVYGDGSRYDPATDTWKLLPAAGAPSAREEHVAVWTGQEMVVWGGAQDRSGARYNPVTDTWRPMSTANAPTGRWDATVVWTGTEMIIWGGIFGGALNDGGRYNPASDTWTGMAVAPLAPRAYHATVWTGTDMIVWGGYNGFIGQMYGDGARYRPSTNTWTPIAALNVPNARYFHTAVWTGTEMIVWGGLNYPTYDLSGGRYNPATDAWTPTALVGAPSLRWMHAAVWTGTEMIVQGGTPAVVTGGRYRPATDTWTATSPVNAANNGQGITAVWTGTEMILWGGLDDDNLFHYDGGRYDPASDLWRRTGTMNVPRARGLHSAVWTGSEMMVWGGYGWGFTNTGGLYTPATDSWRTTSVAGAPSARENATAVWTGTEAIFWGGDPESEPSIGTGGRYDPAADTWADVTLANAPNERFGHSAIWTGGEMIVFGGQGTDAVAKRYRPATDTWTDATTVNAPGARDHHAAVWTGTEMIVWGGFINDGITPTGGRYDPATDTWRPTNVDMSPPTRMWPIGEWTGTKMIVWGGLDWLTNQTLGDGALYDPVADFWTPVAQNGAPSPRVAQGVWTGRELLLWGGANDASGGRYTPPTSSWRPTTLTNAPHVRCCGRWSTVWTGSRMIIWGGADVTQKGNLYCVRARGVSP